MRVQAKMSTNITTENVKNMLKYFPSKNVSFMPKLNNLRWKKKKVLIQKKNPLIIIFISIGYNIPTKNH